MTAAPPDPTGPRLAALRLQPGERVVWKGQATYKARSGTLSCTNRRVTWVGRGRFGTRRAQWALEAVERVELVDGPERDGTILWVRNGEGAAFQMSPQDCEAFAYSVESVTRAARPSPRGASGSNPRASARARLQHIERLRRQGLLTDAEFQAERDGARR